ncbi:MAG: hypothetical protein L6R42_000357 [Xanthoria sp. 1 TBL-2021]|nr:MAG: hypothetical protein L6R42_000357 [Xanthoria sp. 1 TBL-2021]
MQSVPSGKYTFYNCKRRSDGLILQLQALFTNLEAVLHDLDDPRSSAAFNAFFKDLNNAPFVRRVIENITTGAPTSTVNDKNISLSLVCLDGPGQVISTDIGADMYTRCMAQKTYGTVASTIVDSPDHRFARSSSHSTLPALLPYPNQVAEIQAGLPGAWVPRSLLRRRWLSMIDYQMWTLMHELAHIYLFWTLGSRLDLYTVNECLALRDSKTIENVHNYVYYAASEFPSLQIFTISTATLRGTGYWW